MRHDSGTVTLRNPNRRLRRAPACRVLAAGTALTLLVTACASAPAPDLADTGDGAGCKALVGRYVDAARGQPPEGRPPETARAESLVDILGLDPSTGASVPRDERAVEVLHVVGDRYSLSLGKTTLPDAVSLWDTPARCIGTELQLQSASRYESTDGVHVTRQKMKVALYGDADSTLILRRTLSQRAIGLLDVRPGGGGDVELYRFARFEGRPAR